MDAEQALEKTGETKDLRALINSSVQELGRALPDHMRPERLVRIALTSIRTNPELTKCTPESLLGALFTAAQIGVEPIAGRSYLIPFNNKRKIGNQWKTFKEVQFVLGYRGLAELFYRHEKALQLSWGVVHEKDSFDYRYGTDAYLHHHPALRDRGKTIGFYVIAKLQGGGEPFLFMTKEECIEHGKKHSKTYDKKVEKFHESSPWATNEEAMCLKTVLIQLSKLLPLSVELQRVIAADETSREYRRGIDDMLDLPDNTDWGKDAIDVTPNESEGGPTDAETALNNADSIEELESYYNGFSPETQATVKTLYEKRKEDME